MAFMWAVLTWMMPYDRTTSIYTLRRCGWLLSNSLSEKTVMLA